MKTRQDKIIRRRAPNYWAVKITRYFNYSHSGWQVCGFSGGLEDWNRTARQRIGTRIFFLGILFLNNKELGCNISVKFIWFYCLQSESVSALSLLVPSRPRRMFMKWREKCKIIKTNNDYTTQASYWIRGIEAVQGTLVTLPVLSEDLFPPCWPSERCHDVDVLTHLVLLMRWLVWLAWLANSVASWK